MIVHLSFEDIVAPAADAVSPAELAIRDFGLLQAARPMATASGQETYPTVDEGEQLALAACPGRLPLDEIARTLPRWS